MTTTINLEEFDKHIQSVQSQINFLAEWLDSVHDADWLASEIITLKGATGMLHDKWRHLRKRTLAEGIAIGDGKTPTATKKKANRLSIEGHTSSLNLESRSGSRSATPLRGGGAGPSSSAGRKRSLGQLTPPVREEEEEGHQKRRHSELKTQDAAEDEQKQDSTEEQGGYEVQYVDVTDVVNRRLQESRLRHLMESTPTSQKRKRDALGESAGVGEQNEAEETEDMLAMLMSPTKKLKTFGHFEQVAKSEADVGGTALRKRGLGDPETDSIQEGERREQGRANSKRRRKM